MIEFIFLGAILMVALLAGTMNMAASTAHSEQNYQPRGDSMSFVIADGTSIWRGSLVGITSGYLTAWADAAAQLFCGLLFNGDVREKTGTNAGKITGETSDSPPPEGIVLNGGITLMHLDSVLDELNGSLAATDVGMVVYCGTSNTDDMGGQSSGANHPVGVITRFRSATDVDVTLFSMMEHLAQKEA